MFTFTVTLFTAFFLLSSFTLASEHARRRHGSSFEGLLGAMKRHHPIKPRSNPRANDDPWTFVGCFSGNNTLLQDIALTSTVTSLASCQSTCFEKGFNYIALGSGQQCHCSNSIDKTAVASSLLPEAGCTTPASPGLPLGGTVNLLSLYARTSNIFPSLWPRLGCFTDTGNPPALGSTPHKFPLNSPLTCSALCAFMGSTFAGLENGDQCFCGNTISWTGGNAQPVADSECSTPCPLLNIGTCGGTNRIEIYASPSYALSSPWDLKQNYEGPTFFDEWEFFTRSDPTHGAVNYNNAAYSWSKGLVSINGAGNAIMRVDTTPNITSNRDSVRISTIMHYDGGLVILDAVHMPVGCGTWPAFWSLGTPTWPVDGEIDIVEGVHFAQQNLMSIHTENGCTMPTDFGGTGTLTGSPNCDAHANSNTGCGIRASGPNTYGEGFNSNGGGVYAMIWDDASGGEGIRIWFFPRGSVPFDVSAGEPQPSGWGTPQARWPSTSCNPPDFFKSHMLVFDTTLCGDWAGAAGIWSSPVNNGQVGGSCATRTGYSTCVDYIRARGEDFTNAYWEVKSVKLYQ